MLRRVMTQGRHLHRFLDPWRQDIYNQHAPA